ncbi:family 43 glycosylhydrolase [Flavobacterium rhizosphaerae]|uniref:Family 43 glycosylhydrolase n=1 Tax=Flavobacterium rhizosphaerae TaxID=3163298 RepID=A0ABW8YWP4_9FLAO
MKKFKLNKLSAIAILLTNSIAMAQNPIIRDQYSADPSARVFGNKVYLFPSHDIPPYTNKNHENWFSMEDYHVFSSENLTDWTDHGIVVTQNKVPWVKPDSFSMWAPDCIERNGKYYFYFPSTPKDSTVARGFTVGVAIADKPEGPYKAQEKPIAGVKGIDPNVFIDKNGQAYLYWSQGNIYAAKLKENMLDLDSEPVILADLPTKGLKEGPYLFERNGIYYLTYPHVENKTERLEYAVGDNPLGPFTVTGVIMDESPTGCWTNHHSVIQFKKQWYLFYHHNDLSPEFDKNRSVRIDSLSFNTDGTIKKVIPTLRGVGLTDARTEIQIDRYSAIGGGASVAFLNHDDAFKGWKTVFAKAGAFVQYNAVDFGSKKLKKLTVKALADKGATIEIRIDAIDGPLLATVKLNDIQQWDTITSPITKFAAGVHNLYVISKGDNTAQVDWVSFN